MELLVILGIGIVLYLFFSNNKTSSESGSTVTTTTEIEQKVGNTKVKQRIVEHHSANKAHSQTVRPKTDEELYVPDPHIELTSVGSSAAQEALSSAQREQSQQRIATPQQPERVIQHRPGPAQVTVERVKPLPSPDSLNTVKECGSCGDTFPSSHFYPSKKNPDGLSKWCKHCLDALDRNKSKKQKTKVCPKCNRNRRFTSYFKSSKYPDGLTKWCKDCLGRHNKGR